MSLRVILVPMFCTDQDATALNAALGVAKRFNGHVNALHTQPDPADMIPMVGEGVSADTIRQLFDGVAAAAEQQRKTAMTTFDQACAAAGVPIAERPETAGGPSAAWAMVTGHNEDIVPEKALISDLVVFAAAQSETVSAVRPAFEAVLLKSRRPILLARGGEGEAIGHNIAIAWNKSAESASALTCALPFLKEAVAVHLLTTATSRADAESLKEAADYLAWHDIGYGQHIVDLAGETAGAALLRQARDVGADLLVMGGYGHNRLRERILGGVTHHVLTNSEMPVLLAH